MLGLFWLRPVAVLFILALAACSRPTDATTTDPSTELVERYLAAAKAGEPTALYWTGAREGAQLFNVMSWERLDPAPLDPGEARSVVFPRYRIRSTTRGGQEIVQTWVFVMSRDSTIDDIVSEDAP